MGYGATLGGTTQVSNVVATPLGQDQVVMHDIGGVPGALKAWMPGIGTAVINDTAGGSLPAGSSLDTTYYKFPDGSGTLPGFLDFPILAPKDVEITITAEVYLDETGMIEPQLQLIDPADDPFVGGAVIDSDQAAHSAGVWQTLSFTYTATYIRPLVVRLRGEGFLNDWWGGVMVTQAGGGGGMLMANKRGNKQ